MNNEEVCACIAAMELSEKTLKSRIDRMKKSQNRQQSGQLTDTFRQHLLARAELAHINNIISQSGVGGSAWRGIKRNLSDKFASQTIPGNKMMIFKGIGVLDSLVIEQKGHGVYNSVRPLKNQRTEEWIIKNLGGHDVTKGACLSQAFAYAGQKLGFDVSDLNIDTANILASNGAVEVLAAIGQTVLSEGGAGYTAVESPLSAVEEPYDVAKKALDAAIPQGSRKQFILCANSLHREKGKSVLSGHCAIVRRNPESDELEYLELQSSETDKSAQMGGNGWTPILKYTHTALGGITIPAFGDRFGLRMHARTSKAQGMRVKALDIDVLKDPVYREAFRTALGYINTRDYGGD